MSRPVPERYLAQLYRTLARGAGAGLPVRRSLALCADIAPAVGRALTPVESALARGARLADAGARIIWRSGEQAAIRAAEHAGQLSAVLNYLADVHENRRAHRHRFRTGLLLPLFCFLVAVMTAPLPALTRAQLTPIGYLWYCVQAVALPVAAGYCLFRLPAWLRQRNLLLPQLDALQTTTPILRSWYLRRELVGFVRTLGLLLRAGIPAREAWALANISPNRRFREQVARAGSGLAHGGSVAQALGGLSFRSGRRIDAAGLTPASSGEAAGRLDEALLRYADSVDAGNRRQERRVAIWLPRGLYLLLAVWIGWQLVAGAR